MERKKACRAGGNLFTERNSLVCFWQAGEEFTGVLIRWKGEGSPARRTWARRVGAPQIGKRTYRGGPGLRAILLLCSHPRTRAPALLRSHRKKEEKVDPYLLGGGGQLEAFFRREDLLSTGKGRTAFFFAEWGRRPALARSLVVARKASVTEEGFALVH